MLGLVDQAAIRAILAAHPRRRGGSILRRLAGIDVGITCRGRIRSPLEVRFRSFAEAQRGWPPITYNVRLRLGDRVIEVDALIPEARVAIELDGRSTHNVTERFYGDRERDRLLVAHGYRPVRVTGRDLDRPAVLAAELALILGRLPLARTGHA